MWKFNPFTQKEPTGLEGRTVDVGNIRLYVRNAIAEGGFSCVYLARDGMHAGKQYALKHIICNDTESLDIVMKEISVMKVLGGHPNVITLVAHTILDMGRTKEAMIVMEFCDKSLVAFLENRGAGYFEEKQVLVIFRDVCNAVFAMHSQSPPIAHRDLKAENLLLGADGAWKLCDFGSTSTNHKCFDRPEEMGIEEDNIRKYTTPAYRAPEMWDLYRKEVISEKVDIWALGCILYRICYLKFAFDGESKLQILNGNYRIPEVPKYSAAVTGLIKDMLEASPDARPDITQVWFRVNEQLPLELQKHLPEGPPSAVDVRPYTRKLQDEGVPKKTNLIPQRVPPPPPSSREQVRNISLQTHGAFWSTEHAEDTDATTLSNRMSPQKNSHKISESSPTLAAQPESKVNSQNNKSFDSFVADFDTGKLNSGNSSSSRLREDEAEKEVNRLKEQLKQANLQKAEITSKSEKLSAICRSQRQEIQELRRALAAATPSPQPTKESSKNQSTPGSAQSVTPEKIGGGLWELEQGMLANNSTLLHSVAPPSWQAFPDEPKAQPMPQGRPSNGHQNAAKPSAAGSSNDFWAFGQDIGFSSATPSSQLFSTPVQGNTSQTLGGTEIKKVETKQPVGWAGF